MEPISVYMDLERVFMLISDLMMPEVRDRKDNWKFARIDLARIDLAIWTIGENC